MQKKKILIESIERLKKKRDAIILAHVYQKGDIQDIADYVGDSLDLSKKAVSTGASVIVFCGVKFMAETAAILNPDKTILIPDMNAGCELADMATGDHIIKLKDKRDQFDVVSYVNSSAEVKAISDICCTSANAVNVVNSLTNDTILFVPDRNLGSHVSEYSSKEILLWDGFCYVHENISIGTLICLKEKHPESEIIVHPECRNSIRHLADFIGSTSQMSEYVKRSEKKEFIVGTEDNFIYRLKSDNPDKIFYPVKTVCRGMDQITLDKVNKALENLENKIQVPEPIRRKAEMALEKMIEVL